MAAWISPTKVSLWPDGARPSLRWIVCHMIEEYAQHNGHADLLRASVDGQTGSRDAEAVWVLVIDRFSAQLSPLGACDRTRPAVT